MDRQAAIFQQRLENHEQSTPGYKELWDKVTFIILEHGGRRVLVGPDPEDTSLLSLYIDRGQLYSPKEVIFCQGLPSRCYDNAMDYADEHKVAFAMGYALSEDDQLWRNHAWAIDLNRNTIIESTADRSLYWGINGETRE